MLTGGNTGCVIGTTLAPIVLDGITGGGNILAAFWKVGPTDIGEIIDVGGGRIGPVGGIIVDVAGGIICDVVCIIELGGGRIAPDGGGIIDACVVDGITGAVDGITDVVVGPTIVGP